MSAALVYSLAPCTLNATTLATANLRVTPAIAAIMARNSGNEFGSVQAVTGAEPRVTFSTPYYEAYNLIGLKGLALTTCDIYLAKFLSGIRTATSVHTKYALASSAAGFAYIKSISGSQNGIVMADVEIVLLSSDGMTHPLSPSTNNALPSLGSQPALRTIGPMKINGTAYAGAVNVSVDLSPQVETMVSDGDLYPRVCTYKGGSPVITVEHGDPESLRAAIGFTGAALASNFIQYFKTIDGTTQLASATADTLTVASGRVMPVEWGADNLAIAKGGVRVECLSSSATHPIVVATGATAPTP
jgi:hypothetical protein